jgi:hypothetical protein
MTTETYLDLVKDLPEYTAGRVLYGFALSVDNQKRFTGSKIADVVSELRELRSHFNGSEIQDTAMTRKMEFIHTLEEQEATLVYLFNDLKAAFEEFTGDKYERPVPKSVSRKTETAAAHEADSILAKYS